MAFAVRMIEFGVGGGGEGVRVQKYLMEKFDLPALAKHTGINWAQNLLRCSLTFNTDMQLSNSTAEI